MSESDLRMLPANGVELCVETFGDPADPALLLIGGAAASMDWWDDELCRRLARGPRFVIRYDHRDTGRSVSYEPGAPAYTGADLVEDAVGILDTLGVERAHLVGISMGGAIAQQIAAFHPDRVASLTLIATSPVGPVDAELPPSADHVRAFFADPPPEPDWSDRQAVIDYVVEGERAFAGTDGIDEPRLRELAARVVDRTVDIRASMTNHWLLDDGDERERPGLGEIAAPTLVIHGTADPLFPYGHGEALAGAIPGAHLLPVAGMGHELPPPSSWGIVVPAILVHTAGGA